MNHNYEHWVEGDEHLEPSISNQNANEIEAEIIHAIETEREPNMDYDREIEREWELERQKRREIDELLFAAVNQTLKWKKLFDDAESKFAQKKFGGAFFGYHDAIRTLEKIGVEWIGFVETLERAGHSSLKLAMVRFGHSDDPEYNDVLRGEQFAQFREAEENFQRALNMLNRIGYFEEDFERRLDLRRNILTALQKVMRMRRDYGFLCSTEEISEKDVEIAQVTEQLQFCPKRSENKELAPLEEDFFIALASIDEGVNGSYDYIEYIKPTADIMEQLSEQLKSVYGNDSIQTANALEKVEQNVPYENKEKRFELLQEVLRIRILRLGVKNALVAKSIRALASFFYLQRDNEVLYDALMEYVGKIEKVIGKRNNDDYHSEADEPEIQKWKAHRFIEKYLANTGHQQHELTFDDAAEVVFNWLDKQANAYLNELTMTRTPRRSKNLNHSQRHKKLLAMINQALPIARNIDEDERYPQNTVNLLALLSNVHRRLGSDELAQRYHDEKLGIIARYWVADHDVMKQAVESISHSRHHET